MLRSMTWEQFLEWRTFENLEPFGEERNDYRSAHIVQTLVNLARDAKKYPNGFPLSEFLLGWGDMPVAMKQPQDVKTLELHIDTWIAGHNLALEAKQKRGN
jgi:hypothetical protein